MLFVNWHCAFHTQAFYVDWDFPSVGIVGHDGHRSESKGDFAIRLDALIEANEKTGYLATVKRAIDDEERYVHSLLRWFNKALYHCFMHFAGNIFLQWSRLPSGLAFFPT